MFAFKKNLHKGLRLIPLPRVYKRQPFCIKGAGNLEQAEKGDMCATPDILCVLKEHKRAGKRVGIFNPQVFASCHDRKTGQKNNKTHTHTNAHKHTLNRKGTFKSVRGLKQSTSDTQATRAWVRHLWLHHSR